MIGSENRERETERDERKNINILNLNKKSEGPYYC